LKYPNLLNSIKAIKLAFIRRLFDEENNPWKQSFQSFFKNINVKDVFLSRGNLPENLLMNLPLFYKDLIQFWSELKKNIEPENAQDVCNEYIWFNSHITINGSSIFYKKWYVKGVKHVADIIDHNGMFLMDDAMKAKFKIDFNFMEYYSLRHAIPNSWKNMLLLNGAKYKVEEMPFLSGKCIKNITNKDIYWNLQSCIRITAEPKVD
jgi:hypothetical protein